VLVIEGIFGSPSHSWTRNPRRTAERRRNRKVQTVDTGLSAPNRQLRRSLVRSIERSKIAQCLAPSVHRVLRGVAVSAALCFLPYPISTAGVTIVHIAVAITFFEYGI